MKILWTFCIYNEKELLPYKIDYMKRNNIDYYIFDNMSTDGSWDYLQENNIPSERFDSDGMFNLVLNMKLLNSKIHEIKPDWAILSGADIFYVHKRHRNLRATIEAIDKSGYNAVNSGFHAFNFRYTGTEKPGKDPRLTYMYYTDDKVKDTCIAKYSSGLVIKGDHFKVPNQKTYRDSNFIFLHYVFRHDAKERKTEQYLRRKKAWDNKKTPGGWGRHYRKQVERGNFVSDLNNPIFLNIKNSIFWPKIKSTIDNG